MNFIEFLDQVLLDSISVILVLERGVIIESLSLADFVMIKSEILESSLKDFADKAKDKSDKSKLLASSLEKLKDAI